MESTQQQPYTLVDATGHHQWKWGYLEQLTSVATSNTATATTTTTASNEQQAHAAHPQVQWNSDAPAHSVGTSDLELGNAEVNKEAETEADRNTDRFMKVS